MTKIVLTIEEVNQILVDYSASKGQLEYGVAKVTWDVDRFTPVVFGVTIEQKEVY